MVSDELPVSLTDQSVGPANNSPVLQADPTDDRFVVLANRLDAPDFGCALHVSGDGGRLWVPAAPLAALPEGAEKCYGPEVAFDRKGVLYFLFVGLAGRGNRPMGAFLTSSSDRGRTWSTPRQVLGPLNFSVRMALDPSVGEKGRIHLVWVHARSEPSLGGFGAPPNPIMAAFSDDGGATFSEPVQVSDLDRQRVVAPALALGAEGAVHVAYYDLGRDAVDYQGLEGPVWEEPWSVVVSTSTDGGRRFGPGRVIDDAVVAPERVMLIFTMAPPALAARGARLCAAWTDARNGDADALARCSADGGGTWAPPHRLNDDPLGNGLRQYLPRLSMSPDGRIDAVFLDRREDRQNVFYNAFYTYSSDGGRSFQPNRKLTKERSSSAIGQQYVNASAKGQHEIGARLALLSSSSGAVAAWPDTRNSRKGSTAQDLFATEVVLAKAGRSQWHRQVGAALIVGGLVTMATLAIRRRRVAPVPDV